MLLRGAARSRALVFSAIVLFAAPAALGGEREIIVAAAVSLREPLLAISRSFEAEHPGSRVLPTFGASSSLAAQLRAGAPIDLLVSANRSIVDGLVAAGLVLAATRRTLASNRLVVVVPRDVERLITRPEDLLAAEWRTLALPEPAVPLGAYAREWLRGRRLLPALEARIVATQHARAALAAVEAGHADVGIVYATDARNAPLVRVAYEIPTAEQPAIAYDAVQVTTSRQPQLASDFLLQLADAASLAVLREAGFEAP